MKWIEYEKPQGLDEALTLLQQANGRGRVIAGGTDLLLQLKKRECLADLLVDLTAIEELRQIREEGEWVRIGAGVTHGEVARNPVIRQEARALAQGCGQVGSPQIRHMGTLIGNVVSAQPAADGAIPLMALEAELRVVSHHGEHWVALEEAYRGVGLSAVDSTREVVAELRFKKSGGNGETGFFRMARRRALALPVLNGADWPGKGEGKRSRPIQGNGWRIGAYI
jgi:carbon-monoxide dehydrogenase medium subunit